MLGRARVPVATGEGVFSKFNLSTHFLTRMSRRPVAPLTRVSRCITGKAGITRSTTSADFDERNERLGDASAGGTVSPAGGATADQVGNLGQEGRNFDRLDQHVIGIHGFGILAQRRRKIGRGGPIVLHPS